MKRIIVVFCMLVASASYATSTPYSMKANEVMDVRIKSESGSLKEVKRKGFACKCSVSVKYSKTTNPDGSTTQTTTTTVSCDSPEELARFHDSMRRLGMGV